MVIYAILYQDNRVFYRIIYKKNLLLYKINNISYFNVLIIFLELKLINCFQIKLYIKLINYRIIIIYTILYKKYSIL